MKKQMKRYTWSLFFVAVLGGLLSTSCSDDNENSSSISPEEAERNEYFKYDASDVEVVEETTFNVLDEVEKRIANLDGANSDEEKDMLAYYKKKYDDLQAFAERTADSIAAVNPGNSKAAILGQILEMGRVTLSYTDKGADGEYKKMTLLVIFPTRFLINIDAEDIILGCHYTITSDHERPTNTDFQGMSDACLLGAEWATTSNYLVIMPDYEGYGASKDATHPYLNREVQARQTLKALIVGMNWFTGSHGEEFTSRNVVVEGYSQGGAVAAATYRYWLEHSKEKWIETTQFHMVGAVCGDGPYDPLATLQYYCKVNWLSMPVAPALMLKGLCDTDEDAIKAGLSVDDFVSDAFYKSGIFDRIASKLYTTDGCSAALSDYNKDHPGSFTVSADGCIPTDQALNKETFQYFLNGTEPANNPELLRKLRVLKFCLEKNGLAYNFKPQDVKIKVNMGYTTMVLSLPCRFSFLHGKYDSVVPYDNLQSIQNKWGENAAKYIRCINYYDHGDMGKAFFLVAHDEMVQEMLDGEWEPGISTFETDIPAIINSLKK